MASQGALAASQLGRLPSQATRPSALLSLGSARQQQQHAEEGAAAAAAPGSTFSRQPVGSDLDASAPLALTLGPCSFVISNQLGSGTCTPGPSQVSSLPTALPSVAPLTVSPASRQTQASQARNTGATPTARRPLQPAGPSPTRGALAGAKHGSPTADAAATQLPPTAEVGGAAAAAGSPGQRGSAEAPAVPIGPSDGVDGAGAGGQGAPSGAGSAGEPREAAAQEAAPPALAVLPPTQDQHGHQQQQQAESESERQAVAASERQPKPLAAAAAAAVAMPAAVRACAPTQPAVLPTQNLDALPPAVPATQAQGVLPAVVLCTQALVPALAAMPETQVLGFVLPEVPPTQDNQPGEVDAAGLLPGPLPALAAAQPLDPSVELGPAEGAGTSPQLAMPVGAPSSSKGGGGEQPHGASQRPYAVAVERGTAASASQQQQQQLEEEEEQEEGSLDDRAASPGDGAGAAGDAAAVPSRGTTAPASVPSPAASQPVGAAQEGPLVGEGSTGAGFTDAQAGPQGAAAAAAVAEAERELRARWLWGPSEGVTEASGWEGTEPGSLLEGSHRVVLSGVAQSQRLTKEEAEAQAAAQGQLEAFRQAHLAGEAAHSLKGLICTEIVMEAARAVLGRDFRRLRQPELWELAVWRALRAAGLAEQFVFEGGEPPAPLKPGRTQGEAAAEDAEVQKWLCSEAEVEHRRQQLAHLASPDQPGLNNRPASAPQPAPMAAADAAAELLGPVAAGGGEPSAALLAAGSEEPAGRPQQQRQQQQQQQQQSEAQAEEGEHSMLEEGLEASLRGLLEPTARQLPCTQKLGQGEGEAEAEEEGEAQEEGGTGKQPSPSPPSKPQPSPAELPPAAAAEPAAGPPVAAPAAGWRGLEGRGTGDFDALFLEPSGPQGQRRFRGSVWFGAPAAKAVKEAVAQDSALRPAAVPPTEFVPPEDAGLWSSLADMAARYAGQGSSPRQQQQQRRQQPSASPPLGQPQQPQQPHGASPPSRVSETPPDAARPHSAQPAAEAATPAPAPAPVAPAGPSPAGVAGTPGAVRSGCGEPEPEGSPTQPEGGPMAAMLVIPDSEEAQAPPPRQAEPPRVPLLFIPDTEDGPGAGLEGGLAQGGHQEPQPPGSEGGQTRPSAPAERAGRPGRGGFSAAGQPVVPEQQVPQSKQRASPPAAAAEEQQQQARPAMERPGAGVQQQQQQQQQQEREGQGRPAGVFDLPLLSQAGPLPSQQPQQGPPLGSFPFPGLTQPPAWAAQGLCRLPGQLRAPSRKAAPRNWRQAQQQRESEGEEEEGAQQAGGLHKRRWQPPAQGEGSESDEELGSEDLPRRVRARRMQRSARSRRRSPGSRSPSPERLPEPRPLAAAPAEARAGVQPPRLQAAEASVPAGPSQGAAALSPKLPQKQLPAKDGAATIGGKAAAAAAAAAPQSAPVANPAAVNRKPGAAAQQASAPARPPRTAAAGGQGKPPGAPAQAAAAQPASGQPDSLPGSGLLDDLDAYASQLPFGLGRGPAQKPRAAERQQRRRQQQEQVLRAQPLRGAPPPAGPIRRFEQHWREEVVIVEEDYAGEGERGEPAGPAEILVDGEAAEPEGAPAASSGKGAGAEVRPGGRTLTRPTGPAAPAQRAAAAAEPAHPPSRGRPQRVAAQIDEEPARLQRTCKSRGASRGAAAPRAKSPTAQGGREGGEGPPLWALRLISESEAAAAAHMYSATRSQDPFKFPSQSPSWHAGGPSLRPRRPSNLGPAGRPGATAPAAAPAAARKSPAKPAQRQDKQAALGRGQQAGGGAGGRRSKRPLLGAHPQGKQSPKQQRPKVEAIAAEPEAVLARAAAPGRVPPPAVVTKRRAAGAAEGPRPPIQFKRKRLRQRPDSGDDDDERPALTPAAAPEGPEAPAAALTALAEEAPRYGCSKCRWSQRGCSKCRAQAAAGALEKPEAEAAPRSGGEQQGRQRGRAGQSHPPPPPPQQQQQHQQQQQPPQQQGDAGGTTRQRRRESVQRAGPSSRPPPSSKPRRRREEKEREGKGPLGGEPSGAGPPPGPSPSPGRGAVRSLQEERGPQGGGGGGGSGQHAGLLGDEGFAWLGDPQPPPAGFASSPFRHFYSGFVKGGEVVYVGDCVELAAAPGEDATRLAELQALYSERRGDGQERLFCKCRRYYRREDTIHARGGAPGELFLTNHIEERVALAAVLGRRTVLLQPLGRAGVQGSGAGNAAPYFCTCEMNIERPEWLKPLHPSQQ